MLGYQDKMVRVQRDTHSVIYPGVSKKYSPKLGTPSLIKYLAELSSFTKNLFCQMKKQIKISIKLMQKKVIIKFESFLIYFLYLIGFSYNLYIM